MDRELGDTIPTFNQPAGAADHRVDITNLSALTSALGGIRTWAEIGAIVLVAVLIVGGAEVLLRALEVPQYIMPPPSMIATALVSDFHLLAPHIGVTLAELLIGFAIGAEHRTYDVSYKQDDFTVAGLTFYNAIPDFTPPNFKVNEIFGELRLPILKDQFIDELTISGAARYAK